MRTFRVKTHLAERHFHSSVSASGDLEGSHEDNLCMGRKGSGTQIPGQVPNERLIPEAREAPISLDRISPSLFLFLINLIFPRKISRRWSSFSFKSSGKKNKKQNPKLDNV